MKFFLLLPAFLFLFTGVYAQHTDKDEIAEQLLGLVNEYRAKKGLGELKADKKITKLAEDHSERMAKGKTRFGHGGFDERYEKLGKNIKGFGFMAENVCMGHIGAQRVFKLWLGSTGHRKNMESNTNLAGIGIAEAANGELYFTMIYVQQTK